MTSGVAVNGVGSLVQLCAVTTAVVAFVAWRGDPRLLRVLAIVYPVSIAVQVLFFAYSRHRYDRLLRSR